MKAGKDGYDINCAARHGPGRQGQRPVPPLAANPNVLQVRDNTIVRVVLAGTRAAATTGAILTALCDAQPGLETQQPAGCVYSHLGAQQLGQ